MSSPSRLLILALALLATSPSSLADTLRVWLDDAHTRKVEVSKLNPDDIADPSSFGLGAGSNVGEVGVSFGWSRKKGIEYTERLQAVLDSLQELCKEFNRGEMSLETYHRRRRSILGALDHARVLAMELAVRTSLRASEAGDRLNEAIGWDKRDASAEKQAIVDALALFSTQVQGVEAGQSQPSTRASELLSLLDEARAKTQAEQAIDERLARLERGARSRAQATDADLIPIWKDDTRKERILVPRLNVEGLVDDFEESLGLRLKYSAPLITQYVGDRATWMLDSRAKYDQAAQILIVKYRRLCLDYNSGILSQQSYVQRLAELIEAEERAFDAREQLIQTLNERKDEMRREMDKSLGGGRELPDWAKGQKERAEAKRRGIPKKDARPDSVVEGMAREHLDSMAAWEAFQVSVDQLAVELPGDAIEVRVNDREERTVTVPRLDTDLIAQNYETRLTLHISIFNFGPEADWTRKRGIEYQELAQELILKSKQLCADYNAGLVSMETYERRSRAIDASVDAAGRVRSSIVALAQAFKRDARSNLEHLRKQRRR